MAASGDRPIKLEIWVKADQSALLEGLALWWELGLIEDSQIKKLSLQYLTCPLPIRPQSTVDDEGDFVVPTRQRSPQRVRPPLPAVARQAQPSPQNFITARLQSLMAEVSVIWLLLLGVFMVVVSSGVLAASQWRNVAPEGQYSILLGYTLAFWGAGWWTGQQANLTLTARMLQIATLLIIPVNFWMIDGFRLWQRPMGWAIAVIAALVLTTIQVQLLRPLLAGVRDRNWLLVNGIGLSWLHLGWSWPVFPITATYLGTVGTAWVLFQQDVSQARSPNSREHPADPSAPSPPSSASSASIVAILAIALAVLLLIGRAILVVGIPVSRLGLAIAIGGWLLCWLWRQRPNGMVWTQTGSLLLVAGWLVSVRSDPPWQAIAVSGLALWLLSDRLRRSPQLAVLTALFGIGLQAYWLLWWLLPGATRQLILENLTQAVGWFGMPMAFAGVAVFPYLGLALGGSVWLRRSQRPTLADWSELLALLLGLGLSLLSLPNPSMRSLNLLLSTVALAIVIWQRSEQRSEVPPGLIYLTHAVGLAAIGSGIDWVWPTLATPIWAIVLLAGMVIEWSLARRMNDRLWRQSTWYFGLLLAALSYVLELQAWLEEGSQLGIGWIITPIALTALAYSRSFPYTQIASWLSIGALVLLQPLTLEFATPRLLSLGMATGIMLLNTYQVPHIAAALLTVGFGLSFAGAGVWQVYPADFTLSLGLNLAAIAVWILWLLRDWTRRQTGAMAQSYTQATDGWAIALVVTNLMVLTAYDSAVYAQLETRVGGFVGAIALTTLAIAYRLWQQPSNAGFYGLAWGVELLVARWLMLPTPDQVPDLAVRWAIANLALGLATQLAGDLWVRWRQQPYWLSWHSIPLLYAGLGFLGAHLTFTATTGFYTLAIALVGMGVGRRQPQFRSLSYIALLGVSVAAYELLVYQLLQASGGQIGDGVVLLGALGTGLAIAWRLVARWIAAYMRLVPLEIQAIAHLHWIGSSTWLLLALVMPLSDNGERLWLGVTSVLAAYALIHGRQSPPWTYTGIITAWLVIGYGLDLLLPEAVLLPSAAAIASLLALIMSILPWQRWGWPPQPWERAALILPGLVVCLTVDQVALPSLLIVAVVYAWFARVRDQVRLSYLSIILADWAIIRYLERQAWGDPLWYAVLLGISFLYVIQVDPSLQSATDREKRHWLRCLALGLICLTAVYESETSLWAALFTLVLSIVLILVGLSARVRAFLYVGTATFVIQILRQLWLLINDYSLLLWAIGIVLGLAFIWIAATFEARRSQVTALVQYWMSELTEWE